MTIGTKFSKDQQLHIRAAAAAITIPLARITQAEDSFDIRVAIKRAQDQLAAMAAWCGQVERK